MSWRLLYYKGFAKLLNVNLAGKVSNVFIIPSLLNWKK